MLLDDVKNPKNKTKKLMKKCSKDVDCKTKANNRELMAAELNGLQTTQNKMSDAIVV